VSRGLLAAWVSCGFGPSRALEGGSSFEPLSNVRSRSRPAQIGAGAYHPKTFGQATNGRMSFLSCWFRALKAYSPCRCSPRPNIST
jgi:hypothetical protein